MTRGFYWPGFPGQMGGRLAGMPHAQGRDAMGLGGLLLSRGGRALSVATALVIGVIASIHTGVPTEDLSLHDGGVWVTNASLGLVAHLNYPSRTLDGGVAAPSDSFDVTQEARDVLVHDTVDGSVYPIDVALVALGSPVRASGLSIIQGGGRAALVDPGAGKIWGADTGSIGSVSPEASTPIIEDVMGAEAVLGTDGSLHAVSKTGLLVSAKRQGDGWGKPTRRQLSGITDASQLSITTVGSEPVVLDRSSGTIYLPSTQKTVEGLTQGQLQQPGPAASVVAVQTPTALVKITVRKGDAVLVPSGSSVAGTPVAPVVVNGCRYAAWSVTGQYVRDCDDASANVVRTVDKLRTAKSLTFRTNRDVVVINDLTNGDVFVLAKEVTVVNNWDDVVTALKSKEQKDDKQKQQTEEQKNPDRTQNNQKPDAVDDSFGVRPGRSTTLPVLQNDTDPDGDVLTAVPGKDPVVGTLKQVRSGAALQITVPPGTTGGGTFTYTADDGRGGTDEATVTISIHPLDVNNPPVQWRTSKAVSVVSGGEVTYDVRPDWQDPDGDQIYVSKVESPNESMTAKVGPDGTVAVKDLGKNQPGRYDLKVTVSDGSKETDGVLHVDVRAKGTYAPVANADFARVLKGEEVVVKPLENDTDPSGSALRLAKVDDGPQGTTMKPSYEVGSFRFTATAVGTYYLGYVVSNGPAASKGVIRIDVVDPVIDAPPVADDDLALLPSGGSVVVPVLENDFDPTGGVMVIQAVGQPKDPNLSVEVVDHAKIRVSAPGGLKQQSSFSYTVSNGHGSASGNVTVVPLPAVASGLPPVAEDDVATVRTGDVVTVYVLDNDSSPSGLKLTLDPTVQSEGAVGEAFVAEKTVRFKAGMTPGTARVVYTVRDSQKGYASAQVKIEIRAADSGNTAPVAPSLTARVLAGASVKIPVSLDGVDPDGDSVSLLGVDTAPSKGTVSTAAEYLEYSAPADASGTDSFTYTIMDRFGARSVGTVKVGIAPPSPTNDPPIAISDSVIAPPDRQLQISVLDNDIDPNGDALSLVSGSAKGSAAAEGITVETVGRLVTLTTPHNPGIYPFVYQVSDGHGGVTNGQITVNVKSDAPKQAPIARDDVITGDLIAGKTSIDVDVLANDADPDGSTDDLTITTDNPTATVKGKGVVSVALAATRQVFVYTVTDADKLSAKAVIVVPGTQDRLPVLKSGTYPVKMKGGDTLTVNLADFVSVRDGHTAILTFENRVKAGPGANGSPLVKDAKTLVFTPVGEYVGKTALTFEVTDGTSADDTAGLKAVLTLPIEVQSSGKTRPKVSPSKIQVAALEDPTEYDLLTMVSDPDEGDMDKMSFELGDAPTGFEVSVSGHVLKASVPASTKIGTAGLVPVTVKDGSTTPVLMQLPISAIASTRPLITTSEAVITAANAGKSETVDLAQYTTNPFADHGKPLTMVGQPVVVVGTGSVSADGLNVTVAPSAGFHGQLTVSYTLADATGQVDRQVQGKITLTVRDRPDKPTSVVGKTNASRSATVSWQPGANNGAQISKFTVKWNGGSKDCGQATVCELTNLLTNNVVYTFTVVATNEVGDSDASDPSNDTRPDVKPEQPAAPTVKFGDKQIDVAWVTPRTEGSPVEKYTLEISGAVAGATQVEVTGNSYTWPGLTNGQSYLFRVQAHSKAEQPSDWSSYSSSDPKNAIPAGLPLNLVAPTVTKQPASTLPPSATVSWGAPNGNGDNAMTYELRRTGSGTVAYTGSAPTAQLTLSVDTADQTFEFRAMNKSGWSAWSPASAPIRAFQTPGAVTNVVATATGVNNQVSVTFTPAPGNGALATEISYVWNAAGGSGTVASGGTITYGGLVNGNSFQISISARSTVRGESVTGVTTPSNAVIPFGPPNAPTVSASGGVNNVTLSWNATGSGNGRAVVEVQINTTDGGQAAGQALTGSTVQGNGRNQTKCISARAKDETGLWGAWSGSSCGSTWGNPSYSWSNSGSTYTSGCKWGTCEYVNVTLSAFNPNSTVYCYAGGIGAPDYAAYYPVDGSGNYGPNRVKGTNGWPIVAYGTSAAGFGTCEQR